MIAPVEHYSAAATIGGRIQAARRARGFSSAQSLAEAIGVDRITRIVIENIENGRKPDPTVGEVLNIARVLGVPVDALLAPLGRPDSRLDLPALGPAFDGMTAAEFDEWCSATGAQHSGEWSADEVDDRELVQALREQRRAAVELARRRALAALSR